MDPVYAHVLAERALSNYKIVSSSEDGNSITALISAVLFVLVGVKENIIEKDKEFKSNINTSTVPNELKKIIFSQLSSRSERNPKPPAMRVETKSYTKKTPFL